MAATRAAPSIPRPNNTAPPTRPRYGVSASEISPMVFRLALGLCVPMVVATVMTTAIMMTWVSTAPKAVS